MTRAARLRLLIAMTAAAAVGATTTAAAHPAGAASPTGCPDASRSELIAFGGATLTGLVDIPTCASGTIVARFHGSPAAGCAARGVCTVSGEEAITFGGGGPYASPLSALGGIGDLTIIATRDHGRRALSGGLDVVSTGHLQGSATGGAGPCTDSGGPGLINDGIEITHGIAMIQPSDVAAWSGSRCAGPLGDDLTAALPRATVTLTRLLRGRGTIKLDGTRPFAAGGFAGSVASAVTLQLGAPHGSLTRPPAQTHAVPSSGAQIRGTASAGRVTIHAVARPPGCRSLGACGAVLRGAITLAGRGGIHGTLDHVTSPPGDPDPMLPALEGEIQWHGAGTLAVHVGGCRDSLPLTTANVIFTVGRRDPTVLRLALMVSTSAYDPLRTRCEGPELGEHQELLTGSIPVARLLGHSATLRLAGSSVYVDHGWHVRLGGSLSLEVRAGQLHRRASSSPGSVVSSNNLRLNGAGR